MTIEEQWPELEKHVTYNQAINHGQCRVILNDDQYNEARKAVLNHDKLVTLAICGWHVAEMLSVDGVDTSSIDESLRKIEELK